MASFSLGQSPDYIKKRLARSDFFNWLKDTCTGTHEKNIIQISRGWLKKQNYSPNKEESKVIRDGLITAAAFTSLGLGFPAIVLFAPSMRSIVYNSRKKKIMFWTFAAFIGYVNYNSSYQTYMYNILQLNNSPMAYCSFQILCLPEYKRFRNKWQSAYNLSAVAHRYADYNLHQHLTNPLYLNDTESILMSESEGEDDNDNEDEQEAAN